MTTEGRRLAETGIAQAKQAYERWAEAGETALNAFEASTGQALAGLRGPSQGADGGSLAAAARGWAGLREIAQQVLIASDTNMRAGFDLAESLVRAPDLAEAAELQRRFLREQAERLVSQMTDLQKTALRVTRAVAQPETKP